MKPDPIHFIATGGTIDKIYYDAKSSYEVGPPQVEEILRTANVSFTFQIEPLLAKDSLLLTDADRLLIRERVLQAPASRIVITHGTDTMAETGRALTGIAAKTIVLTGAMQPARFQQTDAAFNLGVAVAAVQTLPAGVYLTMNGCIFDPMRVIKDREQQRFVFTE